VGVARPGSCALHRPPAPARDPLPLFFASPCPPAAAAAAAGGHRLPPCPPSPPPSPAPPPPDLSSVFNWNVKQLFVYVSATYPTQRNGTNEVVVWDRVVNSSAAAVLKYTNEFNKYPLVDRKQELRNTQITLSLSWDIMPITGLLKRHSRPFALLQLPRAYCLDREASGGQKVPPNAQLLTECEVLSLPLPGAGSKRAAGAAAAPKKAASWADEI
jgi:hypothetical protein